MNVFNRLYKQDLSLNCKDLALYLLGKILVRKLNDGTVLRGRIVETEAYLGGIDKGSNTFGGRRTLANEPLYMPPGTAFIYMTYGMYFCFNISSLEPGGGVLLRGLEPINGIDIMKQNRSGRRKGKTKTALKETDLCNGPSKLCMALGITKEFNAFNLADLEINNDKLWLETDNINYKEDEVIHTSRVGIARAGPEWAEKKLRFYVYSSLNVSVRDKKQEKEINIM